MRLLKKWHQIYFLISNKIYHKRNCYWNADDIDQILEVLEKNNTKITFFIVGDWIDKYPEYVKKIANKGHEIRKPQ